MNFGGFLDSGGGEIPYSDSHHGHGGMPTSAAISQPRLTTKSMFTSPGLSLALQTSLEGQGEVGGRMSENNKNNFESSPINMSRVRPREEEHDISRSGSDNMDGGSGDDQDAADDKPPRKKRYHRHTPQQIQELESLFKECPHPDEKQRLELSKRLCLETRQVKFWFQNRRTQMKTQLERHENSILRQENDKLRAENISIREAMRSPMCANCGGPAMIGEISLEEQHLRLENARLKEELERVCALAGKFLGRPVNAASIPSSNLELGMNVNGFGSLPLAPPPPPEYNQNHQIYLEVALAAMEELVKKAQTDAPLWHGGSRAVLDEDEYVRMFNPVIGMKPSGFVTEASRETGMVIINSLALVETLMDANKWSEMFPTTIARTTTTEVISGGLGGTRNGALQLMKGELQVLSPLVPIREVTFLRFCKQHAEGVWAVVDVSVDSLREVGGGGASPTFPNSRRLPSGCLVQDMPNGYSKVTWVDHSEYDETLIHQLYRPLISSGMGFGAARWIATLQRQCQCLAILMSPNVSAREHSAITQAGRRSMLKLAQRMTDNFCAGVCASTVYKWNKLNTAMNVVDENVRVMTRQSIDDPGEPAGIVLSAATSVWMPVSPQRLFDFLRDERLRSEWDILSNGAPMQEMTHIAKGQDQSNCVSLLRAGNDQGSMLILQETSIDAAGSLVVYAPVDIPAMTNVINGGDSNFVALLPSGFSIVPDGIPHGNGSSGRGGGSLLTVAFQILVNSLPTAKLTMESVETVNNLITCTVQKIKGALNCES